MNSHTNIALLIDCENATPSSIDGILSGEAAWVSEDTTNTHEEQVKGR